MRKIGERFVKVLVEFEKNPEGGCDSKAECAEINFLGGAHWPGLITPSPDKALCVVMAFNDETKQGLSGRDCTGRVIQEGPDKWIYEVDARLSQWEVA